ncbi:MAG: hypothetical protein WCP85_12275 [Mariniphaga sp.]
MRKFTLFIVLSFWVLVGIAQDQIQTQEPTAVQRKTVIKYMPVNYFFESTSFEIERMINSKNSVTLGFGLPTNQSVNRKYGTKSTDIKDDKFGTMHIRAAYRHYAGKKGLPSGFYIEPSLKYQKVDYSANGSFTDGENVTYNAELSAKFNTFNVGFQMGVQCLLFKRISLDWYFLGIEGGLLNGDINAKVNPTTYVPDMNTEVKNFIADLPAFLSNKLNPTQTSDAVNVNARSLPVPWLRTGFSIGIAF